MTKVYSCGMLCVQYTKLHLTCSPSLWVVDIFVWYTLAHLTHSPSLWMVDIFVYVLTNPYSPC